MSIKIFERYGPNRANPPTTGYPLGSVKNESLPGANDGTPLDQEWGNDMAGFLQALLTASNISASGNADTVTESQYLQSIMNIVLTGDYFTDQGTVNNYDLVPIGNNIAPVSYSDGQLLRFIPDNTSTSNCSITVGGLTAKPVVNSTADTFIAGVEVTVRYQSVNDSFVLLNDNINLPLATVPNVSYIQSLNSDLLPDGALRLVIEKDQYGAFVLDKTDNSSQDNTSTISTIVVDAANGRWIKRSDSIVTEPYVGLPLVTNYVREKLITQFNWNQNYDNDAGSALSLVNDQDLGRLKSIEFSIPDLTANDGQTTVGDGIERTANIDKFRVTCKLSGEDVKLSILTQSEAQFNSNPITLSTGEIATPVSEFLPSTQYFVRVKKGIGQGKLAVEYQYQDPKTKSRNRQTIWVIDLDDGLAVRDYDLLLPQCSSATMLGQFKLGDSTSLNYVISAVSGPVQIEGAGINPVGTNFEEAFQVTKLSSEFPATGEWQSPVLSQRNISGIRFFLTQINPGDTIVATDIRIEAIL